MQFTYLFIYFQKSRLRARHSWCVRHVVLVYSLFNDLVITLSPVIEMTAMHYYTNLMVCNYSS